MVKPVHKGNHPYRHRLMDLGIGMLGGVLAGAGVSYLISSRQSRRLGPRNSGGSTRRASRRTSEPAGTPSNNRKSTGTRRRSKPAGTNLRASNITPQELQAKEEPGTNDSLGG